MQPRLDLVAERHCAHVPRAPFRPPPYAWLNDLVRTHIRFSSGGLLQVML